MKKNLTLMVLVPFLFLTACQQSNAMQGEGLADVAADAVSYAWTLFQRYRGQAAPAVNDGGPAEEQRLDLQAADQENFNANSLADLVAGHDSANDGQEGKEAEGAPTAQERWVTLQLQRKSDRLADEQPYNMPPLTSYLPVEDVRKIVRDYALPKPEPKFIDICDQTHPIVSKLINGYPQEIRDKSNGKQVRITLNPSYTWPMFLHAGAEVLHPRIPLSKQLLCTRSGSVKNLEDLAKTVVAGELIQCMSPEMYIIS